MLRSGLPLCVAYFALGLLLLALFVAVYPRFTPYREIESIRQGKTAAAVAWAGR